MPSPAFATAIAARLFALMSSAALLLAAPTARAQTPAPAATAQTVRIGGTGSALGTLRLLGQALAARDPAFRLIVVPNLGSSGGLRALHAGAIDAAVASRPLKPEELAGMQALEYGRSPFVLVSSRSVPSALTLADLAALLDGSRASWPDGSAVRPVLRPPSDGDSALLAAMSPQVAEGLLRARARPGMVIAVTDQDAVDEAERMPGSLAATTLALLHSERRSKLQVLPLDGVMPSVQALADGRYPHFKPLLLVTRANPSPAVAQLIALLRSAEGRALLVANGHLVPP